MIDRIIHRSSNPLTSRSRIRAGQLQVHGHMKLANSLKAAHIALQQHLDAEALGAGLGIESLREDR